MNPPYKNWSDEHNRIYSSDQLYIILQATKNYRLEASLKYVLLFVVARQAQSTVLVALLQKVIKTG